MKRQLIHFQSLILIFFALCFGLHEFGSAGRLSGKFLQNYLLPPLRGITNRFTDLKFRVRGVKPVTAKIVIVEIDSNSLDEKGRWPWSREIVSQLVERIFDSGAKAVGLDILFSEENVRVPAKYADRLAARGLSSVVKELNTDWKLAETIANHRDQLVLSWITEAHCQPLYSEPEQCPIADPRALASEPEDYPKFALSQVVLKGTWNAMQTPIQSTPKIIANLPLYNQIARHAGFGNSFRDTDGVVRRTSPIIFLNGKAFPSMPLEMARVAKRDSLKLTLDSSQRVEQLEWTKEGKALPISPSGIMQLNFRGPEFSFPYVSAMDLFSEDPLLLDELNRKLTGMPKQEVFKDALVLVGLSALGVSDIAATPFTSEIPGVEVHATLLDNLLSDNALRSPSGLGITLGLVAFMLLSGWILWHWGERLSGLPILGLFGSAFLLVAGLDLWRFGSYHENWNTSFVYLQTATLFIYTVTAKYVSEERGRRFLRNAFSKYVSPAVVDAIVHDPTKLKIGGERREISLLFSDIRGFTTLSEAMEAKKLSEFLNEYFDLMTELVFASGGTLDKYIGDALMAFWGAPIDDKLHAVHACQAGIEMMKQVSRHHDHFKSRFGIDLRIGIGINSGSASVGNMGSKRSFGYTAIGDEVNLASRLEGITKLYGVGLLTSRATLDLFEASGQPVPSHRVLDCVTVKGKKQVTEIVELAVAPFDAKHLAAFMEARAAYLAQEFRAAEAGFNNANQIHQKEFGKDDPTARLFEKRSQEYAANPPPSDWDGTWTLHRK